MSDDAPPAGHDDQRGDESDDPRPDELGEPLVDKYERYETRFQPDEDDLTPDPPEPDKIPADLQRTFWSTVAAANVGLLATSLGAMLVGFRGQWGKGGALVIVGVAALGWTYYRFRAFKNREEGGADRGNDRDDGRRGDGTDRGGSDHRKG